MGPFIIWTFSSALNCLSLKPSNPDNFSPHPLLPSSVTECVVTSKNPHGCVSSASAGVTLPCSPLDTEIKVRCPRSLHEWFCGCCVTELWVCLGRVSPAHPWRCQCWALLEVIPGGAGVSTFAEGFVGQCSICGVPSGNSADNPFLPTSLAAWITWIIDFPSWQTKQILCLD